MEPSSSFLAFFIKPFFLGLYVGLAFCGFVYFRMMLRMRELKKEINKLKQHLHTKLEIDAEANEGIKTKIDNLKEENENLRITIQSLSNKPGRKEIKQFHIYQKALDIMSEKAPGFAPAWQSALKESETEMSKMDKGLIPFIKKLSGGGYVDSTIPDELEISEDEKQALPDKTETDE